VTGQRDPERERGCSSPLTLTSTIDGSGNLTLRPEEYTAWNDPVPTIQEAVLSPGPVRTRAENFTLTGIQSPDGPARNESLYRLSYPDPSAPL